MYPQFLQMIFDAMHPELERTSDTLDVKSIGPNTFGLMKQVQNESKVVFKGITTLVKFGKFVETKGVQIADAPIVMVVEEHVTLSKPNLIFLFEVSDDDDDINDDDDDDDDAEEEEEEEEGRRRRRWRRIFVCLNH